VAKDGGYFLVARKLRHWPNPANVKYIVRERDAMTDLIEWAAWKDGTEKDGQVLNRGEVLVSNRYASTAWQWSRERVRRFLKRLEGETTIETRRETTSGTIYLLTAYRVWQGAETASETRVKTTSEANNNQVINKLSNTIGRSESESFAAWWALYPKRSGGNPRAAAVKAYACRLKEGITPEVLSDGIKRYAEFCRATDKIGTPYIQQASTWLSPTKRGWEETWECPDEPMSEMGVV